MKQKLFTLLTLLLAVCSGAWAGDVYKISFNGKNVESKNGTEVTEGTFFSWNSSKHNFNTKFKDCTYDGVSYTSGLKMEGATNVSWTSTAEATVTIVQSTWSTNTIKFDGTEQTVADAESITGGRVYTISSVAAGSHSVTRGSGESGIFAIIVEYTGAVMTQLDAPTITVDQATGSVTIGSVTNATKVTYTTDGTTPTADSDEYTTAFTVTDGTTVKAIAIGDGTSYTNSNVATQQALLTGITIADPVVKQSYGTVAITSTSPNATIEYSIDGGTTWSTYARAFTLTSDTNLKARASRTGCTASNVVDASITAVAANANTTKTLVFGYGAFDASGKVLTGKSSDVANGYTLTMLTDQDKSWSGRTKIDIASISEERTTICGSNGVQCRLDLPTGVKATRLALYSYVNSATSTTNSAWKEVNGENLNSVINNVPMGAFTDLSDYTTNPDIRIFPLDEVEGSITFTNGGLQTCFVIELDIIEADATLTITTQPASATYTVDDDATALTVAATPSVEGNALTYQWYSNTSASNEGGTEISEATSASYTPSTATAGTYYYYCVVTEAAASLTAASNVATITVNEPVEAVEAPVISAASGSYYVGLQVTLTCATDGATIYYKEDGSKTYDDYTKITSEYSSARTYGSTGSKYLSVYAEKNGVKSEIVTATYNFVALPTPTPNYEKGKTYNHPITLQFTNELLSNGVIRYTKLEASSGSASSTTNTSDEFPAEGILISTTTKIKAKVYDLTGAKSSGSGFDGTYTISIPANETYTTSASRYTTVTSGNALDFSNVEGLTAFIAKEAPTGGKVKLTKVEKVPANTSFILYGAASTEYTIPVLTSGTTDDVDGNLLAGHVDFTTTLEENAGYILSGGKFYPCSAGTLAKGKCYLAVPYVAGARALDIVFDDDATGISNVYSDSDITGNSEVYNLRGQRIAQPSKGLYIVNGKKVVVK
ncbi:MAG: chitobiase/beta-hexosaminidase C-terminal domain-containing protein [Prevotella sp.]|nr:chitobiase/beta-hexosaminidase C-terminal domain-containing protein [Prevotella sp.]